MGSLCAAESCLSGCGEPTSYLTGEGPESESQQSREHSRGLKLGEVGSRRSEERRDLGLGQDETPLPPLPRRPPNRTLDRSCRCGIARRNRCCSARWHDIQGDAAYLSGAARGRLSQCMRRRDSFSRHSGSTDCLRNLFPGLAEQGCLPVAVLGCVEALRLRPHLSTGCRERPRMPGVPGHSR